MVYGCAMIIAILYMIIQMFTEFVDRITARDLPGTQMVGKVSALSY